MRASISPSRMSRTDQGGPNRSGHVPMWVAAAAVVLLAIGLAAMYIEKSWSIDASSHSGTTWKRSAVEEDAVFEKQPRVAFLGDSYTQGTGTDNGSKAFVMRAAEELRWSARQFAVGGSGYSGPPGQGYGERLQQVIDFQPDYVVVSGSRNDTRVSPAVVHDEAVHVFRRIREHLPKATLIVVGPIWVNDEPPADILRLNDEVRMAAEKTDAIFIDALDPSWMDGSPELIADDGIHPTEAGHEELAIRFVAEFREADPAGRKSLSSYRCNSGC